MPSAAVHPPLSRSTLPHDRAISSPNQTLKNAIQERVRCYLEKLGGEVQGANNLHEIVMNTVEAALIEEVLNHYQQNQSQATRTLGISRTTLRNKIAAYHIPS